MAGGVDHVVRLACRQGLAKAFMAGLQAALEAGADIIVNTDADNQYCAKEIPRVIEPIMAGKADMTVGVRAIAQIAHFSPLKKIFQRLGSWVVRQVSRTEIRDAPSGFRAVSRDTAMRLNVFSEYTYTLETIIQAGLEGMAIVAVPIRTNGYLRPSRLIKSIPNYIIQSILTIIRIFMTYKPLRFFFMCGLLFLVPGLLISLRFIYYYFTGGGSGHIQSLILSVLLMGTGFFLMVVALVADLISVNRKLLKIVEWRTQKIEVLLKEGNRYVR